MIKKWIRKMVRQALDKETEHIVAVAVEVAEELIPSASDIASDVAREIDMYDLAQEIDTDSVAQEISPSDVADYMSSSDVAECIEIDVSDIEVDYGELASCVVEDLDLEEIARHADVDSTIFTHIHMLQTRLEALIAVVNDSAMNTIDLMTFNKALEGEE